MATILASVRTASEPYLAIYKGCIGYSGEDTVVLRTGEGGALPEKLVHYLTHRLPNIIQPLRGVVEGACSGTVALAVAVDVDGEGG